MSHGRKPSHPMNTNKARYAKAPKRVKQSAPSGSGWPCSVFAFMLLAIPVTIVIATGGLIGDRL